MTTPPSGQDAGREAVGLLEGDQRERDLQEVAANAAEVARIEALRGKLAMLEQKITNLVAAVEGAEAPPEVLIQQLSERSLERDRLKREIDRLAAREALAAEEIQELVDYVGGLASALANATNEEKAELYEELGLDLTYDPLAHQLRAELVPGGVHLGVSEEGFAHLDSPSGPSSTWLDSRLLMCSYRVLQRRCNPAGALAGQQGSSSWTREVAEGVDQPSVGSHKPARAE